jgi:hypothetical protein
MKETLYRQIEPGRFAPVPEKPIQQKVLGVLAKVFQKIVGFIFSPKTIVVIATFVIVVSGLNFINSPVPTTIDSRGNSQTDLARFLCNFITLFVLWICVTIVSGATWFICGKHKTWLGEKQISQ